MQCEMGAIFTEILVDNTEFDTEVYEALKHCIIIHNLQLRLEFENRLF